MDFDAIRTAARRVRHEALSVCAHYSHPSGVEADVRCKSFEKDEVLGDIVREGFAEMIGGAIYLRFSSEELDQQSVVLARGGRVTMPDGSVLILDALMRTKGPINTIWRVAEE